MGKSVPDSVEKESKERLEFSLGTLPLTDRMAEIKKDHTSSAETHRGPPVRTIPPIRQGH